MPKGMYDHKYKFKPLIERFWSKVDIKGENECWEWTASLFNSGYGQFRLNGKMVCAHRVAYELTNGEIPEGNQILHTCDNRPCCNPSHLWEGTNADNVRDKIKKGRMNDRRGVGNGRHKLTAQEVIEIRDKRNLGYTTICLARQYGVNHQSISDICNRVTWKHI